MPQTATPSRPALSPIEQALLGMLVLGGVAWMSLPGMRGVSPVFGWMPLWLFVLPAAALLTAISLRLSRRRGTVSSSLVARRRRPAPAPRRPARPGARPARFPRAA